MVLCIGLFAYVLWKCSRAQQHCYIQGSCLIKSHSLNVLYNWEHPVLKIWIQIGCLNFQGMGLLQICCWIDIQWLLPKQFPERLIFLSLYLLLNSMFISNSFLKWNLLMTWQLLLNPKSCIYSPDFQLVLYLLIQFLNFLVFSVLLLDRDFKHWFHHFHFFHLHQVSWLL